jgi:hypothetical protein
LRRHSGHWPKCGAEIRIIALRIAAPAVRQVLSHLGEPASPPRISPARGPRPWEIPKARRTTQARTLAQYLKAARRRNESIARAHREAGHRLSTLKSEVGLPVSRVSRIVVTQAQPAWAKYKT